MKHVCFPLYTGTPIYSASTKSKSEIRKINIETGNSKMTQNTKNRIQTVGARAENTLAFMK